VTLIAEHIGMLGTMFFLAFHMFLLSFQGSLILHDTKEDDFPIQSEWP